ncbi:MAG: STAS domain-containing protein [Candidatus Muiribacteriota bacterium]
MLNITHKKENNVTDVIIEGDIDWGDEKKLNDYLSNLLYKNHMLLIIDCQELGYMGSSAIGTLTHIQKLANKYNAKIVYINLSLTIKKIFKTAKLDEILTVKNSKKEAIDLFKN